ncbi:helix-turn-helix domain-containing protein [Paenibacillus humicus]|uniref:helix-turn-helix domain-containing protein n=1 Tax=Paenibacillus humicus TaxID=412861 RepID=UPI003F186566
MKSKQDWLIMDSQTFTSKMASRSVYFQFPASFEPLFQQKQWLGSTVLMHVGRLSSSPLAIGELTKAIEEENGSFIATFGSDSDLRAEIGKRIKGQLAELGLRQNDAATILGITASALSQILSGQVSLTMEELLMMESRLHIKADEVMKGLSWQAPSSSLLPMASVGVDIRKVKKEIVLLSERFGESELRLLLRRLIHITDNLDVVHIQTVIGELLTLVNQGKLHEKQMEKGFPVDDRLLESFVELIKKLRQALSAYPAGMQKTLEEISEQLDFFIQRNKKHKRAD